MTDLPPISRDDLIDPGANWCPDCGLPRGVCDCDERRAVDEDNEPFSHCDHTVSVWDAAIEEYRCADCGEIMQYESGDWEETE